MKGKEFSHFCLCYHNGRKTLVVDHDWIIPNYYITTKYGRETTYRAHTPNKCEDFQYIEQAMDFLAMTYWYSKQNRIRLFGKGVK